MFNVSIRINSAYFPKRDKLFLNAMETQSNFCEEGAQLGNNF